MLKEFFAHLNNLYQRIKALTAARSSLGLIRRYFFLLVVVVLLVHIGWLYFEVGKEIAGSDGTSPSIFYGRPAELRIGTHLGNIHFTERLQKLSYKKVTGKPTHPGTFSEDKALVRIFLRSNAADKNFPESKPVDIMVRSGRVTSIVSSGGEQMDSVRLEPEEICRIAGTKMESRHPVMLDAISPYLQNAVLASEDARFYSHAGIDMLAISRALLANIRERRFTQGGSTITQQLAKNFFLSPQKTLGRKLREAELAFALELRYTKKQILEMYLNKIYWGQDGYQGIYGIEEAATFYFSKHAKDVSLEEAALLAGIIHSPNRYSFFRNLPAAKERRNLVLTRMQKLAMISTDEFRSASKAPVQFRLCKVPVHQTSYFIDYIQRITREDLGSEKFYHTGYRYYTSLDPVMQTAAEESVTRGLEEIERTAKPSGEPLQAALVAVDPATGELTAMVGGRDYRQSQFNRAVDANRQPGSAFKPFVLLAALSQSLQGRPDRTLSSIVSGEAVSISTDEGMWNPSNFEDKNYGKITIRKTIEDSVNTATIRLANDIGFKEVLDAARLAGITSPLKSVPSLALGSFEVTPVEIAYAYATIASGGIRFEPFPLFAVTMADKDAIIDKAIQQKRTFEPQVAYLAGYALEGVLERGTAREAKKLGINFPAAGKTGTTNGNRDSWFVGFTPEVVCAVWVGYDSGADTGLTGAKGALHIWARFMRAVHPASGPLAVNMPGGIETALIDPESGFLAIDSCPQKLREAYHRGTAPRETCPLHSDNIVVNAFRKGVRSIGELFHKLFK